MESIDQIATLAYIRDQRIATQVDYQTCTRCGFRLMRIETTIISDQHLTAEHCPICEQFDNENLKQEPGEIKAEDCIHYFERWLGTHGLDRETLALHYHLKLEYFFDKAL